MAALELGQFHSRRFTAAFTRTGIVGGAAPSRLRPLLERSPPPPQPSPTGQREKLAAISPPMDRSRCKEIVPAYDQTFRYKNAISARNCNILQPTSGSHISGESSPRFAYMARARVM